MSPQSRLAMIVALGGAGAHGTRTLTSLLPRLGAEAEMAATVLGEMGTRDPEAIEALIFNARYWRISRKEAIAAIRALGKLRVDSEPVISQLSSTLVESSGRKNSDDLDERMFGTGTRVDESKMEESQRTVYQEATAALIELGKPAFAILERTLRPLERREPRGVLIGLGGSERWVAAATLFDLQLWRPDAGASCEGLRSSNRKGNQETRYVDSAARILVARMLGRFSYRSEATVRALADTLREPLPKDSFEAELESAVKREVVHTLEVLGEYAAPAADALVYYLRTNMDWRAVQVLASIGPRAKAAPDIEGLLFSLAVVRRSAEARDRWAVAVAVAWTGVKSPATRQTAIDDLIEAICTDKSSIEEVERIRSGATRALARMGSEVVPRLVEMLAGDDDRKAAAADTLALMGSDARDAVPHLIGLLIVGNREVRQRAETALRRIGPLSP